MSKRFFGLLTDDLVLTKNDAFIRELALTLQPKFRLFTYLHMSCEVLPFFLPVNSPNRRDTQT